jgi:hypothetical protein
MKPNTSRLSELTLSAVYVEAIRAEIADPGIFQHDVSLARRIADVLTTANTVRVGVNGNRESAIRAFLRIAALALIAAQVIDQEKPDE